MGILKQQTFDIQTIEGKIKFNCKINVTKDDGEFTTYMPDNIIELFKTANISMGIGRGLKHGFYKSQTFNGLIKQITDDIKKYESMELVEEKIILKYVIQTRCAYCLNGNDIVPNGGWVEDGKYKWITGTVDSSATYSTPYGFLIYVEPFIRYKYKRHDGFEVVKYQNINANSLSEKEEKTKPNLYWIASLTCISQPNGEEIKEIDYTESVALFFVDMIKGVCRLNEKIKDFLNPESIKLLADNKTKLLKM